MVKEIPLTRGLVALVDDADYLAVMKAGPWRAVARGRALYAVAAKRSGQYMHRFILGLTKGDGKQGDHRDNDGLNNQRQNLRFATQREQGANQRKRLAHAGHAPSSTYRGVYRCSHWDGWVAQVRLASGRRRTRTAKTEIAAAKFYNAMATEVHGEFAKLNVLPVELGQA